MAVSNPETVAALALVRGVPGNSFLWFQEGVPGFVGVNLVTIKKPFIPGGPQAWAFVARDWEQTPPGLPAAAAYGFTQGPVFFDVGSVSHVYNAALDDEAVLFDAASEDA